MKFVISAIAASELNNKSFDEIRPVLSALGKSHSEMDEIRRAVTEMREVTHLKYVSVRLVAGEWIFEIDDELMFKNVALIGKVARFIVPLVAMFKMFMHEFKAEVESINNWIKEEK